MAFGVTSKVTSCSISPSLVDQSVYVSVRTVVLSASILYIHACMESYKTHALDIQWAWETYINCKMNTYQGIIISPINSDCYPCASLHPRPIWREIRPQAGACLYCMGAIVRMHALIHLYGKSHCLLLGCLKKVCTLVWRQGRVQPRPRFLCVNSALVTVHSV